MKGLSFGMTLGSFTEEKAASAQGRREQVWAPHKSGTAKNLYTLNRKD
jgi:hypothetical protein